LDGGKAPRQPVFPIKHGPLSKNIPFAEISERIEESALGHAKTSRMLLTSGGVL
jgi:hypothetical protein